MRDAEMNRNMRSVAAMLVMVRRHQGLDEATIRRESMAVASEAIAEDCSDPWQQEKLLEAIARGVDEAIAESRVRP